MQIDSNGTSQISLPLHSGQLADLCTGAEALLTLEWLLKIKESR